MKKTTKILTLGILFLFTFTLQLSAQKCKFDYNKTDPITGEATKGTLLKVDTKVWNGSNPFHRSIGISRIGDAFWLEIEIIIAGNMREIILKDDPFIIKLSNGETITILSYSEVLPIQQATAFVYTSYTAKYKIDAVSLQKIAENPPTFYRINIDEKTYDKELVGKIQNKISQAAACILQ